jgi:hypothetical protein
MASLKEIEEAKLAAKALNEELGYLEDAFTSIGQKIKDNITGQLEGADKQTQELGNKFSTNLNNAIKQNAASLKEITKLQDQIGKGVNVEAKIQKELEKVATRKKTITRQQNILLANGIKLNEENTKQLSSQFSIQEDTLDTLIKENTERQKQKSLFTLLGEGGKNLLDKLDKSGTASKLFSGNLAATVTPMRLLEVGIALIVDAFLELDSQTAKVAESLGVSYHEAQGMNKEFSQIAQNSNNIFVTTAGVANSQMELSKILGTNAMFTEEMLITQTALTHQLGLSAETSGEIAKLGLLTGKTSKEIAANVLGQSVAMNAANGTALTEQQILKDVAKLSSSIQLSMANNPIELAKAVQTAKQFGMELSQVDGIAGSLLNFEQSIENELAAELLLGKNINLEKARQAALDNDLATVAEEIAKQAGSAAEFTAMNRIQAEALAKAVGMSREDLAKSLQDREVLAALGAKEGTALEAYNKLKKDGLSDEAIATKLGDKNLANSLHQESIQARFAASLNKVKELFVQIADLMLPIVEPIADVVGYMASLISKSMGFLKVLGGIAVAMKVIKFIGNDVYRNQVLTNVASKLGLITETEKGIVESRNALTGNSILRIKKMKALYDQNSLATILKEKAVKIYNLGMDKAGNIYAKVKLGLENAILAVSEGNYLLTVKENIQRGLTNVYLGIKSAITTGIAMVSKVNLGTLIAEKAAQAGTIVMLGARLAIQTAIAAAALVGVSASTLGIGTIVALAAAAAGIAYLSSVSKGNDVMSAGSNMSGYGSRTLMGPEGAIALNNKDTVIAGTDLFGGSKQQSSPQQPTVIQQDNSKMEKLLERAINRPDPVIEMSGDRLGTAVGKYAYSIQ